MLILLGFLLITLLFLITHVNKNSNIVWLILMYGSLLFAFLGLSMYQQILDTAKNLETHFIFYSANLVWYLTDFSDIRFLLVQRIINISIGFYSFFSIVQALQLGNSTGGVKLWIPITALMYIFAILYLDPSFINKNFITVGRIMLLGSLGFSIAVLLIQLRWTIPGLRKRSIYLFAGIVTNHLAVLLLFIRFPGHIVHKPRIAYLETLSFTNTHTLYVLVEVIGILSFVLILFSVLYPKSVFIITQNKKIEFNSKMKTAYNGMKILSHSLKNQFIAVKLLTDHYKKVEDFDDEGKEILDKIQTICTNSIERLTNLADKIGRADFDFEELNLIECLKDFVADIHYDYLDINFSTTDENCLVFIDPFLFRSVINNLILNAGESNITVHVVVRIAVRCFSRYVRIDISDDGAGFNKEDMKHVFDPFYTTKTTLNNWGLGLSHSRQIIENFGGSINVMNNMDGGGLVQIMIPRLAGR